MNMRSFRNSLIGIAALALPAAICVAADARQERPFTEHGIVDASLQSGVLVISDTSYHVTDQTQVRTLGGKPATIGELEQGTKVGFNMYGTRAQRYLSDIWVLPAGFDLDSLADE